MPWQARDILRQTALPNCYTLTKHMCEEMLVGLHDTAFPVAIVRPTIIGAIARMPLPGYFGNTAGITAATLAFATGASSRNLSLQLTVRSGVSCSQTKDPVAPLDSQMLCRAGCITLLTLRSN